MLLILLSTMLSLTGIVSYNHNYSEVGMVIVDILQLSNNLRISAIRGPVPGIEQVTSKVVIDTPASSLQTCAHNHHYIMRTKKQ